jgi:CubicO group peptidase (beta-lactamase class C family)
LSGSSRHPRELPEQPSLRYLKVEAKRRLAAGEFGTLHDAQLAVAREHGLPSWTALKTLIETETNPALVQVRWAIARFRGADQPAWQAPAEDELREHFDEKYLTLVPAEMMVKALRPVAAELRQDLTVAGVTPVSLRAWIDGPAANHPGGPASGRPSGLRVEAAVEPAAPHRLTGLRIYPITEGVADPRLADPPQEITAPAPAGVRKVLAEGYAELALVGLVVAGNLPQPWAAAHGWADLDRREQLRTGHRFPAYGTTKVITSTAVLCLAAEGRIDLDFPANRYLRTVRLADDAVTVREMLAQTAGVAGPAEQFAEEVPDQQTLLGSTVACARGAFRPGNGGYAVLGQLIADVTGTPYPEAVHRLVLAPLGLTRSWFPERWPEADAVLGYDLAEDARFRPASRLVCTMPAAGGLWTTAADLVRFGANWSSLLPPGLQAEALDAGAQPGVGLVWRADRAKGIYGYPGAGPAGAASLIIRSDTGSVAAAATNRRASMEPIAARLIRPIS